MATDAIGYAAACLVLATFSTRSMLALRITALASNVAFIAYAVAAELFPVGALHCLLLPLNAWHLGLLLMTRHRSHVRASAAPTARPRRRRPAFGPGRASSGRRGPAKRPRGWQRSARQDGGTPCCAWRLVPASGDAARSST